MTTRAGIFAPVFFHHSWRPILSCVPKPGRSTKVSGGVGSTVALSVLGATKKNGLYGTIYPKPYTEPFTLNPIWNHLP